MIRPFALHDEKQVREIFKLCYPDLEEPSQSWYFATPTFVAVDWNGVVQGFTSFTVVIMPMHGKTMYGQHVMIHPDHRGKGLAKELHEARLVIARDMECRLFFGVAHEDNKAMIKILTECGAHKCVPAADGGFVYVCPL